MAQACVGRNFPRGVQSGRLWWRSAAGGGCGLAHGFQHVGADKDNKIWDTFHKAELTLVEGLAEFYTREFCSTLSNSHPSIIRTFDKTSMYLPEQYRKYQEWSNDYGLETVYQEFIETRRNGTCSFDEFHKGLKVTHKRLG